MRQRDFLHRKALKSKSDEDWKPYKAVQNRVRQQINEAKRDLVMKLSVRRTPAQRIHGNIARNSYVKTNPDEHFTF